VRANYKIFTNCEGGVYASVPNAEFLTVTK
jgi:hypothetical protein